MKVKYNNYNKLCDVCINTEKDKDKNAPGEMLLNNKAVFIWIYSKCSHFVKYYYKNI